MMMTLLCTKPTRLVFFIDLAHWNNSPSLGRYVAGCTST